VSFRDGLGELGLRAPSTTYRPSPVISLIELLAPAGSLDAVLAPSAVRAKAGAQSPRYASASNVCQLARGRRVAPRPAAIVRTLDTSACAMARAAPAIAGCPTHQRLDLTSCTPKPRRSRETALLLLGERGSQSAAPPARLRI
jgi:hypothetical protein